MDRIDWGYLFTSFEGRINRQLFWYGFGAILAINLVVRILIGSEGILQLFIGIALQIIAIAVCVKRCHDRDKSGWWCLLLLIPYVGVIWAIIDLGILEGESGDNLYGPEPYRG